MPFEGARARMQLKKKKWILDESVSKVPIYPYDIYGDIVLDSIPLYRMNVKKLLDLTDDQWFEL